MTRSGVTQTAVTEPQQIVTFRLAMNLREQSPLCSCITCAGKPTGMTRTRRTRQGALRRASASAWRVRRGPPPDSASEPSESSPVPVYSSTMPSPWSGLARPRARRRSILQRTSPRTSPGLGRLGVPLESGTSWTGAATMV